LEQVEWLWDLNEQQPRTVAGHEGVVPQRREAPAHYVSAAQAAVEVFLEDLPMHSLRDFALQLDASNGGHSVTKMLREKAAPEYGESDLIVLVVLSEPFDWVEKGEFYSGKS
jgi:hypothetical protein